MFVVLLNSVRARCCPHRLVSYKTVPTCILQQRRSIAHQNIDNAQTSSRANNSSNNSNSNQVLIYANNTNHAYIWSIFGATQFAVFIWYGIYQYRNLPSFGWLPEDEEDDKKPLMNSRGETVYRADERYRLGYSVYCIGTSTLIGLFILLK